MKSRLFSKLFVVLFIFICSTCGLVWADHPASAEDAIYDRLTRTGATDPLDSLAYSILVRHLKRPSSGRISSTEPQISSYFVVDTDAKLQENSQIPQNTFSSHDNGNTDAEGVDYPPLEYQLPREYAASEAQLETSASSDSAPKSPEQRDDLSNTAENNFPPSPPRLRDNNSAPKSDTNQVRNSGPGAEIPAEDNTLSSSAESSRYQTLRPAKSQPPRATIEIDSIHDISASLAEIQRIKNARQQKLSNRPQPHTKISNVKTHPRPHSQVEIHAFEENSPNFPGNRPKTPKSNEEYSTATVIDLPLYSAHPKKVSYAPQLQNQRSQGSRFQNEVRSSVPIPKVGIITELRVTTPPNPVKLDPAITSTSGFKTYRHGKPASLATKNKEAADLGILASSTGMERAVDLLTRFTEEFVSKDSVPSSHHQHGFPSQVKNTKGVINSVKSIKSQDYITSRPAFILEKAKATSTKNQIPFGLPSYINFFDPPKNTYLQRYTHHNPQAEYKTIDVVGKIRSEKFVNLRPTVTSHILHNIHDKKDSKINLRLNNYQNIKSRDDVNQPLGYEMFKSLIREIY